MEKYKSVGIIAEYNPFHNGHQYHVEASRKAAGAEIVIAVMSGNFTQRGEAAILDKWTRAEMAVRSGVDLVVEMPVISACNHASQFAKSGVNILQNLGADFISFGSECGDITLLRGLAEKLHQQEAYIQDAMDQAVKEGVSWPRARQEAMKAYLTETEYEALSEPNNILALEYLKYMDKACPVTVKREGAGYHDMEASGKFASASFIRQQMKESKDVSAWMPETVDSHSLSVLETALYQLMVQKILTASAEELEQAPAGGEGLGNKIKNEIRTCSSLSSLAEKLKSKRYTRTRVQRFLAQILLGMTRDDVAQAQDYVRVLAFNEKGGKYLKQVKKAEICGIPIVTNINKELEYLPEIRETAEFDILASDLYNLAAGRDLYEHSDFVECVRFFRQNP